MSADNGLLLKYTGSGWELREYCASTDESWETMQLQGTFKTAKEALKASRLIYTEYGVSYVEEDEARV